MQYKSVSSIDSLLQVGHLSQIIGPHTANWKVMHYPLYIPTVMPGQWRTQEFFLGGVQQIQLRTDGRENGDLGVVAP